MIKYFCDLCKEETKKPFGGFMIGSIQVKANPLVGTTTTYNSCDVIDNVCNSCRGAIDELIEDLSRE